jgi:hypothetical protein
MTECFSLFKGRRLRATKLDQCGRVVYGTCSQVVVGGGAFISVAMTDEIQEGTTYERQGADGTFCLAERGCDQRRWINVEYTFCQVDPDLVTMLNPNWMKLLDYTGESIGWAETYTLQCDTGVALELWSDVSGVDVCDDPNAVAGYGYILLPQVVGGRIGDLTIQNDAVDFVLTGRTKKNPKWGAGPYNVMLNGPVEAPVPGPLLVPVGADEPRRIFITTVAPPEASCGCQPLSSPEGPQLTVVEDTGDVTGMTATATTTTAVGTITIDWGDGTATETLPSGVTGLDHAYATPGTYHISVYNSTTPSKPTIVTVTVPFS